MFVCIICLSPEGIGNALLFYYTSFVEEEVVSLNRIASSDTLQKCQVVAINREIADVEVSWHQRV